MPYDAVSVCAGLGIHVKRVLLRDTWGAWVPQHSIIVIAQGLTPIQERCTLAHHVEHAVAHHRPCGSGPYADLLREAGILGQLAVEQDAVADRAAARKLLADVDLRSIAGCRGLFEAAQYLGVTERLLTLWLDREYGEGPWLATSKTAG